MRHRSKQRLRSEKKVLKNLSQNKEAEEILEKVKSNVNSTKRNLSRMRLSDKMNEMIQFSQKHLYDGF